MIILAIFGTSWKNLVRKWVNWEQCSSLFSLISRVSRRLAIANGIVRGVRIVCRGIRSQANDDQLEVLWEISERYRG